MVIIQSARWQCDLIKNILLKELCEIKINSSINQSSNNDIVEHSFILNFDFDSFFGGGLFAFPDNISQGFVSNCRFNFGDAILMECRHGLTFVFYLHCEERFGKQIFEIDKRREVA